MNDTTKILNLYLHGVKTRSWRQHPSYSMEWIQRQTQIPYDRLSERLTRLGDEGWMYEENGQYETDSTAESWSLVFKDAVYEEHRSNEGEIYL